MVLSPRTLLGLILLIVAALVGVALLFPRGGERMVARATSKISGDVLRDCLASRLGLTWQGDARAMRASAYGLRVVVGDNGSSRQLGLFTAGGRPLSSSESTAVQDCLAGK